MFDNREVKNIKDNKKRIMAIVPVASKNRMSIPSSVRDSINLERGDYIMFLNYQSHIGMIKIKEESLNENIKTYPMK